MKTILMTGGNGFLGAKIAQVFLAQDYQVILLIREKSSLSRLTSVLNHPNLVKVFLEKNGIETCFSKYKIDSIIHTATCYGRNNESWPEIAEANLILPLRLLALGEQSGVKSFINADTFFNEKIGFEKNESYYVMTKKNFLSIARENSLNLRMKFFSLKIEQMYGPDDSLKKFIPYIISQLLGGAEQIQMTPGDQKRDLIFVDDVAQAFLKVANRHEQLNQYEEFGIGNGNSVSIKETVEYLKKITASNSDLQFGKLRYRENEIMDSHADILNNSKIDWAPTVDWHTGLTKTVAANSLNKKHE